MTITLVAALCALATPAVAQDAAPTRDPATHAGQRAEAAQPLDRRVTLNLRRVRLEVALETIDRQARLGLSYTARLVPLDAIVTIVDTNITAGAALARVLQGTGIVAQVTAAGTVMLVRAPDPPRDTIPEFALVGGHVRDATSGRPIPGVTVEVIGTRIESVTDDSGVFRMPRVTVGVRTLTARLVGWLPGIKVVTIAAPVTELEFELSLSSTRLRQMVVTATGPQRRLEIGNDLTILDADSIVATQPVRSVTDLLATRVPGLMVLPSSGTPGDPARLRLRGSSSIYLSNDPIIVVDGVRVYSEQSSSRSANIASPGFAAPSPLDQIDPNSIETVEVVKGPSAATLYGQDAANGVIVITTKRGRAGPPRWTASADHGTTYMPDRFPLGYFRWGHGYSDATPRYCSLRDQSCVTDSIVRFQLLNDPRYTVLGHGDRSALSVGVSGGPRGLTYDVRANASDETGIIRLPSMVANDYAAQHGGVAPPEWMVHPQRYSLWGVSTGLLADVGTRATVSVRAALERSTQRRSSLEQQLQKLAGTYYDAATGQFYQSTSANDLSTPTFSTNTALIRQFYQRVQDVSTSFTNSVNLTWRPLSWLESGGDAGINLIDRDDESLIPFGAVPSSQSFDTTGSIAVGHGQSLLRTLNAHATITSPLPVGFTLRTAIGANLASTSTSDFSIAATGLSPGTSAIALANQIQRPTQAGADISSYGWYVAPEISQRRFWLSTGLRIDGGSTFGTRVKLPTFPKLAASYLVSDEPFFPFRSVFNTLRLRASYGKAGTWPQPSDRLRLFRRSSEWLDSSNVTVASLLSLGNTRLRPERATEVEGGFDADLLDDRFSVSLSLYRKTRNDALERMYLPPSVGGAGYSGAAGAIDSYVWANIGVVRNTGLEASFTTHVIRSDLADVSTTVTASRNQNMVVSLGPGIRPFGTDDGSRVQAGYPLFGRWERPILGYADANNDGVIEPSEVVVGDSAVYLGSSVPTFHSAMHAGASLLRGMISLDATLDYQNGFTQSSSNTSEHLAVSSALNDPTAPLASQATMAALGRTRYGLLETVSTIRLDALSLGYHAPMSMARRVGAASLTLAVQGTNLGLWTNYSGVDPLVNAKSIGNRVEDNGQLPRPRTWQLRVSATY